MDTTWIDFSERRPTEIGLFWFRRKNTPLAGTNCIVEFAGHIGPCGMGHGPNELWPLCSTWDGYTRSVPEDLQWRHDDGIASPKEMRFPGLDLLPCPFCGESPRVDLSYPYIAARPWEAYRLKIYCSCGRAQTESMRQFDYAVILWNERT